MPATDTAAPSASPVSTAVTALRAAGERGDAEAVAELLAPDVVFHSPFSARMDFHGREEVTELHRDVFAVLEDLRTTEPLVLGDTAAFLFRGRVRGLELDLMNHVRVDTDGRIAECTIFARPLPAVAALFATLPPRVSARRRGRVRSAAVLAFTRPIAFVLRVADPLAPRLI